ncbi:Netrin receptor UNC5D [Merluccius polli]|uniref:Netrin receptor UNC5 n=1 Tax=Merluccius polli TaxID=89951 RepID=A0AA47MMB1_MERPO|nr:Netrin receptor UNC5D [Merluccius polli]
MSCCHMTKWPVIAVDGGWGAWSAWAACGEDCERQRSRDCAEPEPRHGGRPCDGVALAADNCTGGLCTQNRKLLHDVKPQEVERGSDIALYSGLSAGVLTVVVLVVVVTLYRRNHSEYGVDVIDSSALTGGFQSFTFKTSRQGNPLLINSSMQPDLSVSRTYTSPMCFQDSMDKELMADHSLLDPLPDIKVKGISERAEYHVMSHPRTFPRGVAPDYKGVGVDATLCRRGRTLFIPHGLPSLARPPPPPLPPPLKTTRVFGQAGGRLVVPNTGVSLLVPYGGIAEDTSWEMYMIINQEDSSTAPEEGEEVLLSPEVTYGPSGLDLSCPVALSVAHCADLSGTNNNWSVRLKRRTQDNKWEVKSLHNNLFCLKEDKGGKRFANRYIGGLRRCGDSQLHSQQEVMSVDEESTCCYCLLEAERCHLLLGRPGRYALVGQPLSQEAAKRLRLAVFGSPDAGNPLGYNLRVYCVDDTPHALQAVAVLECVRGGRLLEEPKTLHFSGSGFSLQVSIQDVQQLLWGIAPFTTCQEFSFTQVWARDHHPLQCAFSLERSSHSQTPPQLSCKISVRQVKGREQILQVYTSVAAAEQNEKGAIPLFPQSDCPLTSESGSTAFKIPPSIHQRICATFDSANAKGSDWQLLAQKLHIDRNLSYFACQRSPSAAILNLWEIQHQGSGDVDSLACALEEIDRAQSPRTFTSLGHSNDHLESELT